VAGQEELQKEWVEKLKATTLDDRIFVLTPQARVLELPQGATPIDFAYHLHSEVGHRCRGAKIDGTMVPLNTPLKNGQTCEIITAKGPAGSQGPSRDWLSPGYTVSSRTRSKIRAWFHAQELAETLAHGRALVEKSLQREGKTAVNLEALAHKLGFAKVDDLFIAVGKEKFSLRHVEAALHDRAEAPPPEDAAVVNKSRASSVEQGAKSGVLVVGTEGLMTMLAKCCKPAPPDPIVGFVTRGKGVSIHRASCKNFAEMAQQGAGARDRDRLGPGRQGDRLPDRHLHPRGRPPGPAARHLGGADAREDQRDRREHPDAPRARRAWCSRRRSGRRRSCRRRWRDRRSGGVQEARA
jgi:GTP pyrophosphokinase